MEEALQDVPPLVHDIQERLKSLSETVAVDGKPRSGLPSRRLLWDILKPLASAVSSISLGVLLTSYIRVTVFLSCSCTVVSVQ